MLAIADLLAPAASRFPAAAQAAEDSGLGAYAHLSQPKRRALVKAIGFETVTESHLRRAYGPSWKAVQADLRALVADGLIVSRGFGRLVTYHLDLGSFPAGLLEGLLPKVSYARPALRRAA